jgi:hypothetical protein
MTSMHPHSHFARVTPIVSEQLRQARVALIGLPEAAPLVAYLAASGVRCWLWACPGGAPEAPSMPSPLGGPASSGQLRAYLAAQHGVALDPEIQELPAGDWLPALRADPPDLVLAVGLGPAARETFAAAAAAGAPAVLVTPPRADRGCRALVHLPGDPVPGLNGFAGAAPSPPDTWGWLTAAPLVAGLARAILLRGAPQRRADLAELWAAGRRVFVFGGADPLAAMSSPRLAVGDFSVDCELPTADCLPSTFRTPEARRGALLVAGLGSLGSVAAMLLAPHAERLVLADPDTVDAYNPARQAYRVADIGRSKALALREQLELAGAEDVLALPERLDDQRAVEQLIERHGVTVGLVATGTAADFAIARALRARGVPHVVGRCYPRARYWEAIVVDGPRGPALSDMRGHLRLGPAPAPTPEQIAAYSDAGALEAEPATLVESGWAAAWLARLVAQLLAPPGLRERWLLDLLASEQTCLIGGVGVEPTEAGPAYGVAAPGQVVVYGRSAICGAERREPAAAR